MKNILYFIVLFKIILNQGGQPAPPPIEFKGGIDYNEEKEHGNQHFTDQTQELHSPINIPFENVRGTIVYQPYPSHYINRTFYPLINDVQLTLGRSEADLYTGVFQVKVDTGRIYVTIERELTSFTLLDLRFHIYSEHTLEGIKTELEMQLIHEYKNGIDMGTLKNTVTYLGVAILFSASGDKDSDFLKVLTKDIDPCNDDRLKRSTSTPITTLDLNKFFNQGNPYYYYQGTGTIPKEGHTLFHWFVMKKVEKMSWKQLDQIYALMHSIYPNGNARKAYKKEGTDVRIEYIANTLMISISKIVFLLLVILL